jgi:hypothetical protein
MKSNSSKSVRQQGDRIAFDHGQWEFQSRHFAFSAQKLLSDHVEMLAMEDFNGIKLLPTSQFLASLAVELICKAYYLKLGNGDHHNVYQHQVKSLCQNISFNSRQLELIDFAESNVVWAGRYPTPKWTKEHFKEDYDVPHITIDGKTYIDASKMKNSATPERVKDLLALYSYISEKWQTLEQQESG